MTETEYEYKSFNFDISIIQRDGFISERELNYILNSNPSDKHYGFAKLAFIQWLQKVIDELNAEGKLDEYLTVKQEEWGLKFIGGLEGVRYCNSLSKRHIKSARKQTQKMFNFNPNDIDHSQRDEYQHYLMEAKEREVLLNKIKSRRVIS